MNVEPSAHVNIRFNYVTSCITVLALRLWAYTRAIVGWEDVAVVAVSSYVTRIISYLSISNFDTSRHEGGPLVLFIKQAMNVVF